MLENFPPRTLDCSANVSPILIFTDGAVEGVAVTVGAVILDFACKPPLAVSFGGHVDPSILAEWKKFSGEQVIGQAEILPVLLSRMWLGGKATGRRLLCFIDNNSARHALSRGRSTIPSSNCLIKAVIKADFLCKSMSWYSRVPTHSNPADRPSRLDFTSDELNHFAIRVDMPALDASMLSSLWNHPNVDFKG
jgi:hypothetical protein